MSLSRDQESLLELLLNVKDFLDENGITFYLFGGSCIGALRHKGFIPWDDDVDIAMDRENYNKLIKASYNMPRDDIEFWCFEKSDHYFKAFGQFSSKKDSYFLKSRVFNRGLCMGTLIDVLVMDFVPSEHLEEYKKDLILYEEVLGFYRMHRDELCDYKDEYFELIEREKKEGRRTVVEELQSKIMQYSKEDSDLLATSFWVKKLRTYKKEWFGEPRYVPFEEHMMPIPSQAEATLRWQYGYDWNKVPEVEYQKVHNFYVNHEISSNNYVEDMEQFIDTENIVKLQEGRKRYQVERLAGQRIMRKIAAQTLVKRLQLELKSDIASRNYSNLEPIFANLKTISESGVENILPESVLAGWLMWLIREGRYYDAIRVSDALDPASCYGTTFEDELEMQTLDDCDLSTLKGVQSLLTQLLLVAIAYQNKDYKQLAVSVSAIPVELQQEIPDCIAANNAIARYGNN